MDLGSYSIMSPVHRCLYLAYPAPLQVEQLVYPFQESKKSCNQNTLVGIDIHLATGLAASLDWLGSGIHGPIGAIHGKIGFLMILLVIGHIVKRKKFFFPH